MSRERREGHKLIAELADGLLVGEQLSGQVCPFCDGGSTHEKSLNIQRVLAGAVYQCHRASCGMKGMSPMIVSDISASDYKASSEKLKKELKTPKFLDYITYDSVPSDVSTILREKYGISPEMQKSEFIRWSEKMKRLLVPMKRISGLQTGIVARSLDKNVKPKSITWLHYPDAPAGAFYVRNFSHKTWWVVEDQFSAMRIGKYCNAVAACGSHLSDSMIHELKTAGGVSRLIFALDADAFNKAIKMRERFKGLFNEISLRKPACDPKDMPEAQLRDFIKDTLG